MSSRTKFFLPLVVLLLLIPFLATPTKTKAFVCYPVCEAHVCVNNACKQGYMRATTGDAISVVHQLDLKLAKKIFVGKFEITNWIFNGDILKFTLPNTGETGGVFVNIWHSDGDLLANGTLWIYTPTPTPIPTAIPTPKYINPTPALIYTPIPTSTPNRTVLCNADIWECGNWSVCYTNGVKNRTCTKTYDCPNVETALPIIEEHCKLDLKLSPKPTNSPQVVHVSTNTPRPSESIIQDQNKHSIDSPVVKKTSWFKRLIKWLFK